MTKQESALDVSEEAEQEGIMLPVTISSALAEQLQPNPYLASIGITLEQRITNLLQTANAYLSPAKESAAFTEQRTVIPFMVLQGPFVQETFIPVTAVVHSGEEGNPVITLTKATPDEEPV